MESTAFKVREATQNDLPILLSFEQELIKAERPFDVTIKEDPVSYYDIKAMIDDDKASVLVVESKGQVVASGYALERRARHYLDHKHYAYLGFMYTIPECRGKGLNGLILDALKSWAKQRELHEIRLTVYEDNIPAVRAYEKVGFRKHIVEMRLE